MNTAPNQASFLLREVISTNIPGPRRTPTRRIAFLLSHPIQYVSPLLRELNSRGEIEAVALYGDRGSPADQSRAGFGVTFEWDIPLLDGYSHRFLKNCAKEPTTATFAGLDTPEVATIIEKERFDAVVVNGWHFKSAWQAILACWKYKTPVFARSDSHLNSPRSRWKTAMKWPAYRTFVPRLDGCLAVGTWSANYFEHYGASPNRIHKVPHCIDTVRFGEAARKLIPYRDELRLKWGLPERCRVFLFAGKFIPKKRPMDFIRAFESAALNSSSIAGLMVGDGPMRPQCEEYVNARHLPIKFVGFLNQQRMPEGYVAADVLVLPSDGYETWGLVVNEAMTCGLPALVSDRVGCGPDLIEHGKTGSIFPLGDVVAIAELMKKCEHPRAWESTRINVLQKVSSFSLVTVANAFTEAIVTVPRR